LVFSLDSSCSGHPMEIRTGATPGVTYNTGVSGCCTPWVQLDTTASTPASLSYHCNSFATMFGNISVVSASTGKAGTPTGVTAVADQYLTNVVVSWTEGTTNAACTFASWNVAFASGGTGSVTGCTALTSESVTNCTATGLKGSTGYSFTVQQVCANTAANSAVSATSSSVTTISTINYVLCQNNNTCNCGNATLCVCQNTVTCNCQNSALCACFPSSSSSAACNGGTTASLQCSGNKASCSVGCALKCTGSGCPSGTLPLAACGAVGGSIAVSASASLLALSILATW